MATKTKPELEYPGAEPRQAARPTPSHPMSPRQEAAWEREINTPVVDEVTARGAACESLPTQEPVAYEDGPAGVSETKPDSLKLWKRVEYGWKQTIVPRGAVEACIESGAFRFECGDCGGQSCGIEPNDCGARDPMPFTRCPVRSCRKPLYDTTENEDDNAPEMDDGEITIFQQSSTPKARLTVKVNRHLRFAHLSTAEELGVAVDPLFMAPGAHAMANSMQPVVPFPVHPADRPPVTAGG
jgi:hypothetical protein